MSSIIEVAFKGNRKEFYVWEPDEQPAVDAAVIVEADRGEDLGRVHAIGELAVKRNLGTPHGTGEAPPARKARRLASRADVRKHDELRQQDEEARRKAMERVRANALVMKVSDAEWQWDRKKLTFYFTADKRVDFRTLVRELAATFRTRIELKQIGVRDEAKRLDGIGRCGRQYCSSSWLPELRPVSLGVAKDQRLSLNPTQISGACGRLMCSLRYEHEFYVQARRRFPKEGKAIRTAAGEERVVSNDIFRERVVLRNAEGEVRTITLVQLLSETEASGVPFAPAISRESTEVQAVELNGSDLVDESKELLSDAESFVADVEDEAEEEKPAERRVRERRGAAAPRPQPSPQGQEQQQAAQGQQEQAGQGERRPHRRRGRRGGRRNRGGRRDGGSAGGAPPSDGPTSGGSA